MNLIFPPHKKLRLPEIVSAKKQLQVTASGLKLPSRAVVCPLTPLAKTVTAQGNWKKRFVSADIYCAEKEDFCFVTGFGCGGPAVAMVVEQLGALGVKEIIFLGLAGSLQEEVEPGDMVLCSESICADGTSPHYTRRELVRADKKLLAHLVQRLHARKIDFHMGRNWSTDAIFRETKAEIKHYQKNHALTVEMETSALYAVCARREIKAAAAYVISDWLYEGKWKPDFKNPLIWQNLRKLACIFQSIWR